MFFVRFLVFILIIHTCYTKKYEANWTSLDTRPLPKWFDAVKIGIFIHWGVFAVPSFGSEWFWANWKNGDPDIKQYMQNNYPKQFSYQDFAKDFTAEFFNATEWAELFAKSGAKYVVLTSKHHEGYTMWPSKYSYSWNSKDVGPGRDIVGELSKAVKQRDLIFGVYHSLYEWYNPMYISDKSSKFVQKDFVTKKLLPEMYELINEYRPAVLWSDGDWEAHDFYWNSTQFLAWLYNDSPVKDYIVTNDRWGIGIPCKHGDFYSCKDRYNPGVLQSHKWEDAMTIDKESWGFRRNAKLKDYFTISELITQLASTISCGGNLLVNIGPTKDGVIAPIFQERLLQLGEWLKINGEAIYESKPWTAQNDSYAGNVWYTSKDSVVYAIVLDWDDSVALGSAVDLFKKTKITKVYLLGNEAEGDLSWEYTTNYVSINLPNLSTVKSQWAYVLKIVPPT